MNRQNRFNLGFLVVAILSVLLLQEVWTRSQVVAIPYSEFQKLVREDKVAQVVVSQDQLQGELKEPSLGGKKRFVTVRVDAEMAKELDAHKVQYAGRFQNDLIPMILSWVLPTLIFFGIWMLLQRRMAKQMGGMGGGLMSIGKSRAKVYVETDTKVTFADVAGVDEAKFELQEVVQFLKDPKSYGRLGAHVPKGILLV
jgi:cell division protease FtsH